MQLPLAQDLVDKHKCLMTAPIAAQTFKHVMQVIHGSALMARGLEQWRASKIQDTTDQNATAELSKACVGVYSGFSSGYSKAMDALAACSRCLDVPLDILACFCFLLDVLHKRVLDRLLTCMYVL